MRWIEVLIIFVIFIGFCFSQTTWFVPDDFATIQGAICDTSVQNGDVVIVRAGTYLENIDFQGKNITLKSELGPNVTSINGSLHELSVITFQSGEGNDAVLEGFTIKNGSGTLYIDGNTWGGGVFCLSSSPTIRYNVFHSNTAHWGGGIGCESYSMPFIQQNEFFSNTVIYSGGGIRAGEGCSCMIEYNYIHDNYAVSGGGIEARWKCNPTIRFNRIENNYAMYSGGGIYIGANTESTIDGNLIIGNEAHNWGGGGINLWSGTDYYGTYSHVYNNFIINNISTADSDAKGGGGIYSRYDTSFIYNNTLVGNQAVRGGGLFVITFNHLKPDLSNSIMWGNTAIEGAEIYLCDTTSSDAIVEYCDIAGGWPGTGNIDADPLFVDPSTGDYHLTFNSPCKDIGNNAFPYIPTEDYEGNPRIAYGTVDMGADEFYPHLYYTGNATPSGTIQAKFVGLPGYWIDGVIMGTHIFEQPLPSNYGLWYLNDPMQIIIGLGTIPANGVAVIPGTLHPSISAPSTIYLQAAIDMKLTGLCTVNVQ